MKRHVVLYNVLTLILILLFWSSKAMSAEKINVVTTVAPLTDIVRNVGGDRIDLHGLIPEGTDSHTFEPAPSDVKYISEGDLFLINGLTLETPSEKLILANKKKTARIVKLGDHTITRKEWVFDFSFPASGGNPNPHLWLNVAYAMKYVELTRDALIASDPANKSYYEENAKVYLERLDRLDKAIMTTMATIPPKNRKLVTYHDSWAYFCPRYGCKVIGAIQPSSFAEPSPRDMANLIDQLKAEQVPAVFGSEVFPSKVLDQIGREAGVKYISSLRDDDLPGPLGSPEHSYIGMMVEDVKAMATSLGGDPASILEIKTADTVPSR
jgi:ABC-type Zn uptake system ZnuABC Zn-binding protein ZnuA